MTNAKDCQGRLEEIVAFVMGELAPQDAHELQEHMARLAACRELCRDLTAEEEQVRAAFEALARNIAPVDQTALGQRQCTPHALREGSVTRSVMSTEDHVNISHHHFYERIKRMIIAHKRLSVATAATLTALAASLILYVALFSATSSAYALEQTIQANSNVTSYHFRTTPTPIGHASEGWIELDRNGSLMRGKIEIFDPHDGPKVFTVSKDRAEVWCKIKHLHLIMSDKHNKDIIEKTVKDLEASRPGFDPKLAFEQLQADQKAGKIRVETREPGNESKLVTLTVTSKDKPDLRSTYDVDPESKLVEQVVEWKRDGNDWQVASVREYLDYNRQFGPEVFRLELPKGVSTIDRATNVVGLDKGNLNDDEIAVKVARDFFEAIIAGDYAKASPLYEGVPAEQLKKGFSRVGIKFLRIIEIGKPERGQHPDKRALKVPAKLEIEVRGKKIIKEMSPFIREESGRWTICGGV